MFFIFCFRKQRLWKVRKIYHSFILWKESSLWCFLKSCFFKKHFSQAVCQTFWLFWETKLENEMITKWNLSGVKDLCFSRRNIRREKWVFEKVCQKGFCFFQKIKTGNDIYLFIFGYDCLVKEDFFIFSVIL